MEEIQLTFGQKAVGLTFNSCGDTKVFQLKETFAKIIDTLANEREKSKSQEQKRMLSIAITEAQTSQMWAVNALTWQD